MRILWILNKYVEGRSETRYYPDFLKGVEREIESLGHKIYFVFFSDAMRLRAKTKNNIFYDLCENKIKNADDIAAKLEREYNFTFKQAYFPDQIQVSKHQDYRKIHLPEKEFNNISHLVTRFLFLEKIIKDKKIDVVFCDKSPEVEMEFARSICLKERRIFLRQSESFLGRSVFYRQFEFGKEKISLPAIDRSVSLSSAKSFVEDYVRNGKSSYQQKPHAKTDFREFYLPRILHFYRYPQYIKLVLINPLLRLEEKVLKPLYEERFDPSRPYLFFGFHLPTESTISLRALPYMTQTSLIECVSRVLPYGYYLYVREHPSWRMRFPASYLKKLKALPNVRLISPKIPIDEVLKQSQGVLTYNATTGIEALIYGKPVLSFAPNVYYGLHPSVEYCSDLYELGAKLVKLVNQEVDRQDTYRYIYKLFRSTSSISLAAGTFLSEEDSAHKAKKFVRDFLLSISFLM